MPAADLHGKRLLVLGAGHHQVALIRQARARGAFVVTSDRSLDAPGRHWATVPVLADVLDQEHNIRIARDHDVNAVVTVGTDQALITVAAVAEACGLPCHVTPATAMNATHKIAMTRALSAAGVPTTKRVVITQDDDLKEVRNLQYPLVVKPADSQGQVGTARLDSVAGLENTIRRARETSRGGAVVVEEFVEGPEVTATAWVEHGEIHLLAITDRVTYNPPPSLGIALRHVFPSFHARHLFDYIGSVLNGVATAYSMSAGPLYVQMIVTGNTVAVIEAAARVGGGHEMSLVPEVTGVDLVECSINLACSLPGNIKFDLRHDKPRCHGLVNFIVANPGILAHHKPLDDLIEGGVIVEGGWYRNDGAEQKPVVDAYGRIGWFLATGPDRDSVLQKADFAYRRLVVESPDGRNLVYWPASTLLRGT